MNLLNKVLVLNLCLGIVSVAFAKSVFIKELSDYFDTCGLGYSPGRVNKPMRMLLADNNLFKNLSVGVDIGTGTGILALLMIRSGLKKVYFIEFWMKWIK